MKKLLVALAVIAVAAACGGAAGGAGGNSSSTGDRTAPIAQPLPALPAQPGQPAKSSGGQTGGGSTANPSTSTSTVPVLQGPPVIRQAQLAVTVDSGKFEQKLSDVRTIVEQEGGYIAGTDAQTNPAVDTNIRTGVISFMVPAGNFDTTIDQLAKVGKVESEHISGTDVSAQYVDLNARLANAQAQRQAMLTLLTQAKTIPDIIAVQTQIGQITAQIEELEGQIKYLDQNTSYSTVTVTLTEAGAPAPQASGDTWGFATALDAAAHNFVTTIDYVITGLGAIGPLAVLLLAGYIVWRRRRTPHATHHV